MVEVLIAAALSTIALLGLGLAQLKSLQYATSSFNYTVSLIQANNAVERTWFDLCDLQKAAGRKDYVTHVSDIQPPVRELTGYEMTVVPAVIFANNLNITVSWTDNRLEDTSEAGIDQNQAVVNAQFPQICS
jgi:type IV pilus assembly protein PilV